MVPNKVVAYCPRLVVINVPTFPETGICKLSIVFNNHCYDRVRPHLQVNISNVLWLILKLYASKVYLSSEPTPLDDLLSKSISHLIIS